MRYLLLIKRLTLVTLGFFLVRPIEAFCKALESSYYHFKIKFMETWCSEDPQTPKWDYREIIRMFKEGK